jgi:hypothetical protein
MHPARGIKASLNNNAEYKNILNKEAINALNHLRRVKGPKRHYYTEEVSAGAGGFFEKSIPFKVTGYNTIHNNKIKRWHYLANKLNKKNLKRELQNYRKYMVWKHHQNRYSNFHNPYPAPNSAN